MSDAQTLRTIVDGMTDRPWVTDEDTPSIYHGELEVAVLGEEADNYDGDAAGIVALANHADALVALVDAATRWREAWYMRQTPLAREKLEQEGYAILAALADVESVMP